MLTLIVTGPLKILTVKPFHNPFVPSFLTNSKNTDNSNTITNVLSSSNTNNTNDANTITENANWY